MSVDQKTQTSNTLNGTCLSVRDYEPAPPPSPQSACTHHVVGVSLYVADEDLHIHRYALTRRQEMLIELAGNELELNGHIDRGDATFASTALAVTLLDPHQFSECGRDFLRKYEVVKNWIGQHGIKAIWDKVSASEYVTYGLEHSKPWR